MGKLWLPLWVLFFLIMGCASMEAQPMEVKEAKYGKHVPVITESFASKQLRPGDTWMVYLKASNPDGDMENILCTIVQPGVGEYPLSINRIKKGDRKELNGYMYLPTVGQDTRLNLVNLTLTVQIQDKAGHYSAPVSFPLTFNTRYSQEQPPKGEFQNHDLGPIMIQVHPLGEGRPADGGRF